MTPAEGASASDSRPPVLGACEVEAALVTGALCALVLGVVGSVSRVPWMSGPGAGLYCVGIGAHFVPVALLRSLQRSGRWRSASPAIAGAVVVAGVVASFVNTCVVLHVLGVEIYWWPSSPSMPVGPPWVRTRGVPFLGLTAGPLCVLAVLYVMGAPWRRLLLATVAAGALGWLGAWALWHRSTFLPEVTVLPGRVGRVTPLLAAGLLVVDRAAGWPPGPGSAPGGGR